VSFVQAGFPIKTIGSSQPGITKSGRGFFINLSTLSADRRQGDSSLYLLKSLLLVNAQTQTESARHVETILRLGLGATVRRYTRRVQGGNAEKPNPSDKNNPSLLVGTLPCD
jgi:hypothetical protein